MVPKKDPGDWRPRGDYRTLNTTTVPNRYSIPHAYYFSSFLEGKSIFIKVGLVSDYYQVPMTEDIPKAAITSPIGLFEFTRMPFGL